MANKTLQLLKILILAVFIIKIPDSGRAQSLIDPVIYPYDTIARSSPFFIWPDLYNTGKQKSYAYYRLNLKTKKDTDENRITLNIRPQLYYNNYYVYKYPRELADGTYEYSIERIVSNKSISTRYYHFMRYPVTGEFTIDRNNPGNLDELGPGYLIPYIYVYRHNKLDYGYNALFFTGSGIISFGIGMLFYSVVNFGIISTIIYAIAFTSSAIGLTAAGYYSFKYFQTKRKLRKIIKLGKNASINGGMIDDSIMTELEIQF